VIFQRVAVGEAEGGILAHSRKAGGKTFKKGRVLTAADVAALVAEGVAEVTVVRLAMGDVPEDEAATRIAAACAGDGTERQAAFTGRANLYAAVDGVLAIDRRRLDDLNELHEAVTVATLPPYDVVRAGDMIATVKIIPFSAPLSAVTLAERIAGERGPLIAVARFRPMSAGLVMTRLPATKDSVLDKTAEVVAARLAEYGSRLAAVRRCAHDAAEVADAVNRQLAEGCSPILVYGASAITDRHDEIPAGIVAAGGEVLHFGMPVDPGNLLLLGRHGEVPVLGLPGCARSPKLNGFDWVLQRLLAGLEVTPRDVMRMGAGGLLKEIATRPQPRAGEATAQAIAPRAPRIAAVVLAAGRSSRMGTENKMLAEVDGKPMAVHAVEAALASQARPVLAVTGHEADAVAAALAALGVRTVHNPDYAHGLSTSLAAGLAALDEEVDGAVVMLADMPRVTAEHVNRLIAAFNPVEGRAICVPTHRGKRGNPVLFASRFFAEMRDVAGDVGARHLIGQHADEVVEVAMPDDAIFVDVDTPEALKAIRGA